jgi:RNA polymerase sigma-70 factor (ECF subfamily)
LERRQLVYRVLDRLAEKERVLLVMFEIEEMSGAEIAEKLGVKLGTVWVRLHRARAAFVRALEAEGGGAG